jgi:hypothetical protein
MPTSGLTLIIQQHVLRLQVSVDNIQLMNITDCEDDFGRIKAGLVFRKSAKSSEVIKQFPSRTVIKHKVKLILGLECHFHPHDEWVIDVTQNATLGFCVLDLIPANDVVFAQNLESENLPCTLFLGKKYFA